MTLNNKYKHQDEPIRVLDFVRSYLLSRHVVMITINGSRIDKEDFEKVYINDEDHVTFTSLVSGG